MTSAVEPMMRMVIVANEFASKGDGEPMYEDEETRQLAESAMCMLALHAREKRGAAPTAQSSASIHQTRARTAHITESTSGDGVMSWSNSPATALNGSGRLAKDNSSSGGKSDAEMLDDGAVEDDESEFDDLPASGASSGGGESRNNKHLTTAPGGAAAHGAARGNSSQLPRQRVRKLARPSKVARLCSECGTGDTPSWRRGADGARTLCNACGLQFIRRVKKEERLEVLKNWREGDPEPPRPRGRPLEHPIPPPPRKRKAPMPSPPSPLSSSSDRATTPVADLLTAVSISAPPQQPPTSLLQLPNLTGAPWPSSTAQLLMHTRPSPVSAVAAASSVTPHGLPAALPSLLASIPTRKAAKTTDGTKPKSSVDFLLNSDDGEL